MKIDLTPTQKEELEKCSEISGLPIKEIIEIAIEATTKTYLRNEANDG